MALLPFIYLFLVSARTVISSHASGINRTTTTSHEKTKSLECSRDCIYIDSGSTSSSSVALTKSRSMSTSKTQRSFETLTVNNTTTPPTLKQQPYNPSSSSLKAGQINSPILGSEKTSNKSSPEVWRFTAPPVTSNDSTSSTLLGEPSVRLTNFSSEAWQAILSNTTQNSTTSISSSSGNTDELISAWECYMNSGAWAAASASFASAHMKTQSTVYSETQCQPISNPSPMNTYTLCDGIPRVRGSEFLYNCSTYGYTSTFSIPTESFPDASPTCTIATSDCSALATMSGLPLPWGPPCSTPQKYICLVEASNVRLLYWPAAKVVGSLCDSACPNPFFDAADNQTVSPSSGHYVSRWPICSASRSVIMPSAPGPVTAVLDGHTLTSPTVYYSYEDLTTIQVNAGPPGPHLYNQIVPVDSADVTTMLGHDDMASASLDWSNLNAPIAYMAYVEGYQCADFGCNTIYDDDYLPMLSVIPQVTNLDPAWSTCEPFPYGAFDPPHALQAAAQPATPTNSLTSMFSTATITPAPGPTAISVPATSAVNSQPPPLSIAPGGDPGSDPSGGSSGDPHSGSGGSDPGSADPGSDPKNPSDPGHVGGDGSASGSDSGNPGSTDSGSDPGDPSDPKQGSGGASSKEGSGSNSGGHGSDPSSGTHSSSGAGDGRNPDSDSDPSASTSDSKPGSDPKGLGAGEGAAVASILGNNPGSGSRAGSGASTNADTTVPERSPGDVIASILGFSGTGQGSSYGFREDPTVGGGRSSQDDASVSESASGSTNPAEDLDPNQDWSSDTAHPLAFAGNQPVFADPTRKDSIIVAGHNLGPGDPAVMINNLPVSVTPNGDVKIGKSTVKIPTFVGKAGAQSGSASGAIFTAGSQLFTAVQDGKNVLVSGKTLDVDGAALTFSGEKLSAIPDGIVVNDASTVSFSSLPTNQPNNAAEPRIGVVFTAGNTPYTALQIGSRNGVISVDGLTLSRGGRAATLGNGEIISEGANGLVIADGSQTLTMPFSTLPSGADAIAAPQEMEAIFTAADGALVTGFEVPGRSGVVVVDGHTLSVGGPAEVIDGETVSAVAGGLLVADGTRTADVQFSKVTLPPQLEEGVFMAADGKLVTAFEELSKSGVVVLDGKTLSIGGPAATIDGEVVSEGPDGLVLVDGSKTSTLAFTTNGGSGDGTATVTSGNGLSTPSSAPLMASTGSDLSKNFVSWWSFTVAMLIEIVIFL